MVRGYVVISNELVVVVDVANVLATLYYIVDPCIKPLAIEENLFCFVGADLNRMLEVYEPEFNLETVVSDFQFNAVVTIGVSRCFGDTLSIGVVVVDRDDNFLVGDFVPGNTARVVGVVKVSIHGTGDL